MVSAVYLCLLALGLTAASSQFLSQEDYDSDVPVSERRTFKHAKPVKILPFGKKHKKLIGLVPHFYGKAPYDVSVVHDAPKTYYKYHRYQGIELKPGHDVSFSTPEPFLESHSIEPPTGDFSTGYSSSSSSSSDHSFSSSSFSDHQPSDVFIYDKLPGPIFAPLPPKPIFSFIPAPQPVFQPIPVPAAPSISSVSISHSAPIPPPSLLAPLPSPQPVFSVIPIKIQPPVLPALPSPTPTPIFSSVPIKIHHPVPVLSGPTPAPVLPILSAPSPAPVVVKIPGPVLPALPAPVLPGPTPAPILPGFPVGSATPAPAFPSIPVSLPPPHFSLPAPLPSVPSFSGLQNIPASPAPEVDFPYPPSGSPIPSYIKDISLGDVEIKDHASPTIEPEVSPAIDDGSKNFDQLASHPGFFQKLRGWKADKANAALSHFAQFKPKPFLQQGLPFAHPTNIPVNPAVQFPGQTHSLPITPANTFPIFPPAQFHPQGKYENFPPNNIETPPLLNSYGVPIPHDSYAPPHHIPHDRLSSAASEEEPAVVPAPDNNEQIQQRQSPKFQPQAISQEHPVYVPEESNTSKEENKTIDDTQPAMDEYKAPNSEEVPANNAHNYPNHKE